MNIIYRCADTEIEKIEFKDNRPDWFNKLNCFNTLIKSLENCKTQCKLHIIHDGKEGKLYNHIKSKGYNITKINVNSNQNSLLYCYNFADSINDNIYFVEDDYIHCENAIEIIQQGIDKFGLVTGYDHTDRYTRTDDVCFGSESIQLTENSYWRTAESTTCTWACSKIIWEKIKDIAKIDLLEDRRFFRTLFAKNIRLYTPIPAVTCHMNKNQLSPFVNWEDIC